MLALDRSVLSSRLTTWQRRWTSLRPLQRLKLDARHNQSRGMVGRTRAKVLGNHFLAGAIRCGGNRIHELPGLFREDLLHYAFDGGPSFSRWCGDNLASLLLGRNEFLRGKSPDGKKPNDQSSQGCFHTSKRITLDRSLQPCLHRVGPWSRDSISPDTRLRRGCAPRVAGRSNQLFNNPTRLSQPLLSCLPRPWHREEIVWGARRDVLSGVCDLY
jgi:hypothetical protein